MSKKLLFLSIPFSILGLVGCNSPKTTVSIRYEGSEKPVEFAIGDIKTALERNHLAYVEEGGEYTITIDGVDSSLQEQAYKVEVTDKNINIKGGDSTGLMYGALQVAEEINLSNGIKGVTSSEDKPYIDLRGFNMRPSLDLRTPGYTNNADSARNNIETTWDLQYWDDLFATMARKRYNLFSFSSVNSLPSIIQVPGYENVALNDVWKYKGDYDDSYKGDCTNMFRKEHLENYEVVKKMTIQEKTEFWKKVIQSCVDHGIQWEFSTMIIYTFGEELGNPSITSDMYNETTKDYFKKAYVTLLETFPQITGLKATVGENIVYTDETKADAYQWVYDVYGEACNEVMKKDPERAKKFWLNFAAVGNSTFDPSFFEYFKDVPYEMQINKRYNDTRLYSVTKPTDNIEYMANFPEGFKCSYNLRAEDAYHYTWGDPDFAREFCRNMYHEKSRGFQFFIDGYHVGGKEFEFVDDSLNGRLYYDRHWVNFTMFGRFSYNPNLTNDWMEKLYLDHYEDLPEANVKAAWRAMNIAGKVLPNVISTYSPGGTDAAFLPEMCTSNPTLFGFLDIKRFINNDTADPDGDVISFAAYAKILQEKGSVPDGKRTPFDVAKDLRELATQVEAAVAEARNGIDATKNKEFDQQMLDQTSFALLAKYYAEKFDAAMNLRIYNDTLDTSYQDKSVANLTTAKNIWAEYAKLFLSRFKVERLARHGIIDPNEFAKDVEKDISIAKKWTPRDY